MSAPTGHLITCACGAEGVIVDQSPKWSDTLWFAVQHEGGDLHIVERYWNGEAFRFQYMAPNRVIHERPTTTEGHA